MSLPDIPTPLIAGPMLVLFLLRLRRYYLRDPDRRISDPDFLVAACAVAIALSLVIMRGARPGDASVSHIAAAAAITLVCVALAVRKKTEKDA